MSCQGPILMVRYCTYLVLISEALVAHDIGQTIKDIAPDAHVILALSVEEAQTALAGTADVEIAIVADAPGAFVGSGLHDMIVERGGRVVLLGIEAEEEGPGPEFDVLVQPFDTAALVAKLRRNGEVFG